MATGTIQIEDGELSYEIRGEGSPVVLLHGGFLDGRLWDHQVAALEHQHTVIRYDARGHGQSSTPTKPFAHHEDLRRLLAALGIPRAALVGLSLGARTSVDFALAYPELVGKLVLVSPGISGMSATDPFILDQLDKLAKVSDLDAAIECVLRMWVDGPLRSPEQVDPEVRRFSRQMMIDTGKRHGRAGHVLATELHAIDRAGELVAPTLVLVGDQDSPDIHVVADLVHDKAVQADKKLIPGVGHNMNLERPDTFNQAVLDFLSPRARQQPDRD
jgi:3-oxoadipate enol-lactonase